ncbi:haloacid dehalogenase [Kitasatospora sp. MMS16-BH015]|uniref:HD domain-containing protein n=1 Tax=Kitasatospora sp. MMS16-BH015 TaxID=2018025 RepID=UPI000CA2E83C|nr:HD domain-containing protein [Kitasatospora sp. MMS16-BH015]AUG81829.1 haloacid dehalogenase [Kitasatospora sp. MMS16-BH015]
MEHQLDDADAAGIAHLLFEAGSLRGLPRTGWRQDGIPLAITETVAEHSHRTSVIGATLATLEGADPARTTLLCTLHDLPETRTGDLTPLTKRYATTADPRKVLADQVTGTHPAVRDVFTEAVAEFEDGTTPEARCARDADKLDCLLRALEYRAGGVSAVQGKIDRCRAALVTVAACRIADAAVKLAPTDWQYRGALPTGGVAGLQHHPCVCPQQPRRLPSPQAESQWWCN